VFHTPSQRHAGPAHPGLEPGSLPPLPANPAAARGAPQLDGAHVALRAPDEGPAARGSLEHEGPADQEHDATWLHLSLGLETG
jgi:hypothetical protein